MTSNKYRRAEYSVDIQVAQSPQAVFNRVIDLANWWPEDVEGESIKPGNEFVFRSGEGHYSKNRVVELVPGKKFAWLTTESIRKTDNFDWTGTRFIFELTPKDSGTRIRFTYDGVIFEDEYDRLVRICELTIKEMLYPYLTGGKVKEL